MVPQNPMTEEEFEKYYFAKCLEEIYSWDSYEKLKKLISFLGFSLRIYYLKHEEKKCVYYSIELEVLDASGHLYQVPNPYERENELFHLLAGGNVLIHFHKKPKIVFYNWQEDMLEELKEIISYLEEII